MTTIQNPKSEIQNPKRFHFGLSVTDLGRAVDFYSILFGVGPTQRTDDYARFEVADPPLVLALHPGRHASGGALNHVGFRVASAEALVAVQRRLEEHGIRTQREEGVECCYALQTKFWVPDADRNLWEIYTLQQDLDHAGFGGTDAPTLPETDHEPNIWTHLLTNPPPRRIPQDDASVDEVQLEGTFNAALTPAVRSAFLAEARRVLRPGGRISVHGLVGSAPFPGKPSLPGPAAMVQVIPVETEPLEELRQAGFVGMFYERLGDIHCFTVNGVELREMQLVGFQPRASAVESASRHAVIYRGPFAQLTGEDGTVYPRGVRVPVSAATCELFRRPPFQDGFVCFSEDGAPHLRPLVQLSEIA